MQAAMIAGLLGTLTSSPHVPAPMHAASLACPAGKSEAHRPLLVEADELVEAGKDAEAGRAFISAYDAMDLATRTSGSGQFAADRAVTSFLNAWRVTKNEGLLDEAEHFMEHYLETQQQGRDEGCAVTDDLWAEEKLEEIRALRPKEGEELPPDDPTQPPAPKPKNCPQAQLYGVDRLGVALVTIGTSLALTGTGFLIVGAASLADPAAAFTITGGVVMGAGAAFIIPGAVRLATWRRRKARATLGVTPWTGRGLAGVSVHGRFGFGDGRGLRLRAGAGSVASTDLGMN